MSPRLSKDYVYLTIAVVTGTVGLWVFLSPGTVLPGIGAASVITDQVSPVTVGLLVAAALAAVTFARVLAGVSPQLDRTSITPTTPEDPSRASVPTATGMMEVPYQKVMDGLTHPDAHDRRVVMYGRRIQAEEQVSESVDQLFNELVLTARDAYATGTGCDPDAAEAAIATGAWTDDRIAAAFLASNGDAAPEFTMKERAIAWLAPERVFEQRVDRVMREIERTADVFLTFENPNTNSAGFPDASSNSEA